MSAQSPSLSPASGGPGATGSTANSGVRATRTGWAFVLPLAVVAAAGVGCAWATTRCDTDDRPVVGGIGALAALLLGVALSQALTRRRLTRELRSRSQELRNSSHRSADEQAEAARLAALDLEAAHRAVRATEVQRRTAAEAQLSLRAGGSADTVLSRLPQPTGPAHQRLLDVVIREIGTSERMRAAGMAACASAASRMQALTTSMLADLRDMEERLGEELLGDLLHLDHCTAQTGRLADSVAVLTGSRSGRRWTRPIVMESVLRGAMGRIGAYQRVRLHSVSTAAVAGHAAEGVMHALAELMDNACNFSPPTEEVHVYVQETHSGVVVTIEDAGLVMPDATLARAEKLVSGDPLDLRALSGTRLGLAVVGALARKHGLLISFRPSSRGGTGVVVLIPPKILTQAPAEDGADFPVEGGGYPVQQGYGREGRPAEGYGVAAYPAEGYGAEARGGEGYGAEAYPAEGYPAGNRGDYQGQPAFGGSSGEPSGGSHGGSHGEFFGEHAPSHARPAQGHRQDDPGTATVPLPKRPRGQTLAAARHGDLTPDPTAAWLDPSPEDEARAARSRAAAGSRFSAFRDAAAGRNAAEAHASAEAAEHGADAEYDTAYGSGGYQGPGDYPAANSRRGQGRYGAPGSPGDPAHSGVPGGPGGYSGEEGAAGDTVPTGSAGTAGATGTGPGGASRPSGSSGTAGGDSGR
ncbi:MAG: hypothetical protein QOF98_918 [Streptomyces sp.]|nr:hypothetical protein [Streptomyces sp.]